MDVPISLMGSLMNLQLKRNWTHTERLAALYLQGAGLGPGGTGVAFTPCTAHCLPF